MASFSVSAANNSSTVQSSTPANAKAALTDGINAPFSMAVMPEREMPERRASSACVRPCRERKKRKRDVGIFFMGQDYDFGDMILSNHFYGLLRTDSLLSTRKKLRYILCR
jgi:hypothetical protein